MPHIDLFSRDNVVGVFRGFQEGGLEFHADLVLPYRNEFQSSPMHGQFLLVQLETPQEAVLGRIASFASEGKLSFGSGEEFNIRAVRENRPIPEDLREQYLKYKVNIRVLGVLRSNQDGTLTFVPSHRRLPHVGSAVAFPSGEVLREIAGHNVDGADIGHFALGEYIYCEGSRNSSLEVGMQVKSPDVVVRFPVQSLVSRRSFIFARAGFGKSNLNKLLFSKLYARTPTVTKRGDKQVPVGTIIFDPDGEYFWPDDKGRPGLCDVPALVDKLVVFTSRKSASPFYQSFVAGGIKLDLRRLKPTDVISIALSPERQDQQNVRKLRALDQGRWEKLVDLIDQNGNQTRLEDLCPILDLDSLKQEAEALAARANMASIVHTLHDKSSQFMDMLLSALSQGKLCVVDVSQMRGSQAMMLSGLILRRIFDRNQQEFTEADPRTIPTIAVIEEAQSVLTETAASAEPYIAWVKEGRKYDLGALLITQQPGSIPTEILSQGDNWFIFHLLSSADLLNVRKANAHFSEDLLSALLNEPIPGQGEFWELAFDKDVLHTLCRLREGLLHDCRSDARKALRVILMGALHGPQPKRWPSYLSNQSPRTYAPKPRYAVGYWKRHDLAPPAVNVLGIVAERAARYYQHEPRTAIGSVIHGDSRKAVTYRALPATSKVRWVITSPPYYGMRTYLPDQWLRLWLLGGPPNVDYSTKGQVAHSSPAALTSQLRQVWQHVGASCAADAQLVVRFGGINDRKADPLWIILNSLDASGWTVRATEPAGTASSGRRQALHFVPSKMNPVAEHDVWATWKV